MFFGGIGGFESQLAGNFCARRRGTRAGDGTLNELQNLLLAGREFGAFLHDDSKVGWR